MVLTDKHRSGDSDDRNMVAQITGFYDYTIFLGLRQLLG